MRLYLIRHGETIGNSEKRFQGKKDYELSLSGQKQAEQIADRLKNLEIDYLYSSTLNRAVNTAEIINKHHSLTIIRREALDEYCWGVIEGYNREEIHRDFPRLGAKMEKDFFSASIPGEEGLNNFFSRLKIFENHLRAMATKTDNVTVTIVTHGRVIGGLTALLSGYDFFSTPWPFVFSNASLTELEFWQKYSKFRLRALNDLCHLR